MPPGELPFPPLLELAACVARGEISLTQARSLVEHQSEEVLMPWIAAAREELSRAVGSSNSDKAFSRAFLELGFDAALRLQSAVLFLNFAMNLGQLLCTEFDDVPRGLQLMEQGLHADAVSGAQEALRNLSNSYALHLRLGAAYFAAGHYPEAEATFRELVTAGDPLPTSYVGLAQVLLRTGRAEDAVTELIAAQQKLGTSFLLSYFRGLALDRTAKSKEALSAFQEAVQINPNSAEAHLGLGKTELKLQQTRDAIAELETVLRLNPGNAHAQHLLSEAYRRLGDSQRAGKYAETELAEPIAPEGDLVGDFLLPEWEFPAEVDGH